MLTNRNVGVGYGLGGAVVAALLLGCAGPEVKAPLNLTVSPTAPRALTLTWQKGGGSEEGFRVERKEGESYRELASIPATVTRYEVTGLDPKQSYEFRVTAFGKKRKPKDPSAEASGTTLPLSLEDAVAGAKPSVVLVRNRLSSAFGGDNFAFGTGFVISNNRVVTNHHVIDGASEVAVRLDNTWYVSHVLTSDDTNDLAILSVEHELPAPLPLGDSDRVQEGAALVALGYPKIGDLVNEGFDIASSIAPGVLTAFRQRKRDTGVSFLGVPTSVNCKLIQMSCPINPGNSGGPVLEISTGKVVGVTVSQLEGAEGIKFAVPVNYVTGLAARPATSFDGSAPFSFGNTPSPFRFGNTPSPFGTRTPIFGNSP